MSGPFRGAPALAQVMGGIDAIGNMQLDCMALKMRPPSGATDTELQKQGFRLAFLFIKSFYFRRLFRQAHVFYHPSNISSDNAAAI
jgi:hypothetical protein